MIPSVTSTSSGYQLGEGVASLVPPYAGTKEVVPITSPEELFREGMEMRHCVAIYAKPVAESKCYCYRVLAPVRATLEIRREPDGEWAVGQMSGKCNRAVGEDIVAQTWWTLRNSSPGQMLLRFRRPHEAPEPPTPEEEEREAGETESLPCPAAPQDDYDPQWPLLDPVELAVVKRAISAFCNPAEG